LIDSRFLYWLLKYVTPEIESRASGSTFKEISASGFAATQIPSPHSLSNTASSRPLKTTSPDWMLRN
jgi:hypothetical protein